MKRTNLSDLDVATRHELAAEMSTSEAVIRHIATGRRQASSGMAIRIERAAAKIGLHIPRSDLSSACATCEYAHQCERSKKGKS